MQLESIQQHHPNTGVMPSSAGSVLHPAPSLL
jgi:hypothetical protein